MNNKIKLIFIGIIILLFLGCGHTVANWKKKDFDNYEKKINSKPVFKLKYVGQEVNLKICCMEYVESKNYIEALPVNDIKHYLENKYGILVDISAYETSKKNGYLKINYNTDEEGNYFISYNQDHIMIESHAVGDSTASNFGKNMAGHIGQGLMVCGAAKWLFAVWPDYKEPIDYGMTGTPKDRYKKGSCDQAQIFSEINAFGTTIYIRLCITEGEKGIDGYYKLKTVTQDEVTLPTNPWGCEIENFAREVQSVHELLNKKM
jgi:hypothetical protein